MIEKPLHVRVAEALGCKVKPTGVGSMVWFCYFGSVDPPHPRNADGTLPPQPSHEIARYDTDWSATGPLIERFGFSVGPCAGSGTWSVAYRIRKDGTLALPRESPFDSVFHNDMPEAGTPLLAACHLILALAETGKLPRLKAP